MPSPPRRKRQSRRGRYQERGTRARRDSLPCRLPAITRLQPDYANRAIYGAVAYLKADEAANTYGERQGLFVIRATGSSASITNRADFRPRTFGRSATHAV